MDPRGGCGTPGGTGELNGCRPKLHNPRQPKKLARAYMAKASEIGTTPQERETAHFPGACCGPEQGKDS